MLVLYIPVLSETVKAFLPLAVFAARSLYLLPVPYFQIKHQKYFAIPVVLFVNLQLTLLFVSSSFSNHMSFFITLQTHIWTKPFIYS